MATDAVVVDCHTVTSSLSTAPQAYSPFITSKKTRTQFLINRGFWGWESGLPFMVCPTNYPPMSRKRPIEVIDDHDDHDDHDVMDFEAPWRMPLKTLDWVLARLVEYMECPRRLHGVSVDALVSLLVASRSRRNGDAANMLVADTHAWDVAWRILLEFYRVRRVRSPTLARAILHVADFLLFGCLSRVDFRATWWRTAKPLQPLMIQALAFAYAYSQREPGIHSFTTGTIRGRMATCDVWRESLISAQHKRMSNHVTSIRGLLLDDHSSLTTHNVESLNAWKRSDGLDAFVTLCTDIFPQDQVVGICQDMCRTAAWTARQGWIVVCALHARSRVVV